MQDLYYFKISTIIIVHSYYFREIMIMALWYSINNEEDIKFENKEWNFKVFNIYPNMTSSNLNLWFTETQYLKR